MSRRKSLITCSDIPAILGVGYISRQSLLKQKNGITVPLSPFSQTLVQTGIDFEPSAFLLFRDLFVNNGKIERNFRLIVSDTYPWFGGTPDALWQTSDGIFPVELKCRVYPTIVCAFPPLAIQDIPLKYYLQVQGQIFLLNAAFGFLVLWTFCHGASIWRIEKDDLLWKNMISPISHDFYMCLNSPLPLPPLPVSKSVISERVRESLLSHCFNA